MSVKHRGRTPNKPRSNVRSSRDSRSKAATGSAVFEEALDSITRAQDAVEHAGAEVRSLAVHESAGLVFAETLRRVLGDRPLSVKDARRAALSAAASTVWEDTVGPLLTGEQARDLMGVSRQRVAQLAQRNRLVVLGARSGSRLYPAWQFGEDGRPLAALADAHRTLVEEGHLSPWSAASWCVHEHPELDVRSPREWAATGKDPKRLQLVARRDAARAAQ